MYALPKTIVERALVPRLGLIMERNARDIFRASSICIFVTS